MRRVAFGFLPGIAVRAAARFGPRVVAKTLARADESLSTDGPSFVFRVDDYPRWDLSSSEFLAFDDVFRELDTPYLLGITPWCEFHEGLRCWIQPTEADYLRDLTSDGRVELGLHGFTHKPQTIKGYMTEIAGYDEKALRVHIADAHSWFREHGLRLPLSFIPPFNTLTWDNFQILREHFDVIMAGPSALSSFGNYAPQVCEGTIYLPSYRPLTGLSVEIARRLRLAFDLPQLHAITIHWAWERRTGYKWVKELVRKVKTGAEIWTMSQAVKHFAGARPVRFPNPSVS